MIVAVHGFLTAVDQERVFPETHYVSNIINNGRDPALHVSFISLYI